MPTYALPCTPAYLAVHLRRPWNAPLPLQLLGAHSFGGILSPDYCRRTVARPVSYYALFE
jgi:hypothetical protein